MREGGVIVNDVPKIHTKHPTVKDHSISFPDEPDLLIPLHLSGIFSYFYTRKPEKKELFDCKKLCLFINHLVYKLLLRFTGLGFSYLTFERV